MTTTTNLLNVATIIQNNAALTPNAGDRLFAEIDKHIAQHQSIIIDFSGIKFLTSAFLNASIGQLYAHYTSEDLQHLLHVQNLSNDDLILLSKVVARAKEYFSEKESLDNAFRQVINE